MKSSIEINVPCLAAWTDISGRYAARENPNNCLLTYLITGKLQIVEKKSIHSKG